MTLTTATTRAVELRSLWWLARHCGVTPSYKNVRGERVRAAPEAVLHAVRSYGIDISSPSDADMALRDVSAQRMRRFIEPVNVIWTRGGYASAASSSVRLHLHPQYADRACTAALMYESGDAREWRVDLSQLPAEITQCGMIDKPLSLPAPLPIGYHRLEIEISGERLHSWLFVAPQRATPIPRKCWGAFLPLYSLRSRRNWGIGDFTDLRLLNEWIADRGSALCATLPLLAHATDGDTFNPSPYSPSSRLFWNEIHIDVEAAPEFSECEGAQSLVASTTFQDALHQLRSARFVDHAAVLSLKRRALEMMSRRFFASAPSNRRDAFQKHIESDPFLDDFASFRASREDQRADQRDRARHYHLYAQFLCNEQLSGASRDLNRPDCGLYLDLPVGVHPAGFDAHRFPDAFVHDASAGAPPDDFFTHGQNWGILPLHPQRTREDGHAYFREMIRRHVRFAGALRIDHVMWMHRMYWAPHGMPPSEGVYVRYPADELYAVLCIESQRSAAPIIGENLGTVPAAVDRTMERHGIHPLYVAQFSWTGDARHPLARPPRRAVASLNTHDTPTFAAHWFGDDVASRADIGLISADQAADETHARAHLRQVLLDFVRHHRVRLRAAGQSDEDVVAMVTAILVELAQSDAAAVLVSLEDLWAERRPQNLPGTHDERNWRRKAAVMYEEFSRDPQIAAALERISEKMT